jgi:transcriptional regulator with XRE-family HTH domain
LNPWPQHLSPSACNSSQWGLLDEAPLPVPLPPLSVAQAASAVATAPGTIQRTADRRNLFIAHLQVAHRRATAGGIARATVPPWRRVRSWWQMAGKLERQVGERIAELRRNAGMTQAALAERVNVATQTVSRLERGAVLPGVAKLNEIAAALHVPLAALFDFAGGADPKDLAIRQLVDLLRCRTEADARMVREIAECVFRRQPGSP